MYFNTFALLKIIGIFENSNLPKTTQFRIDIGRFKEKTFLYKQVKGKLSIHLPKVKLLKTYKT